LQQLMTATSSEGTESNLATLNQNTKVKHNPNVSLRNLNYKREKKTHRVVEASFRIQQKKHQQYYTRETMTPM
jgi:hypothetical protein